AKTICLKTRRTPRGKSRLINGTAPTRANKQLSPRRGRTNTNSGRPSPGSTTSMVIEISSAPAHQSRNSNPESVVILLVQVQERRPRVWEPAVNQGRLFVERSQGQLRDTRRRY